MFIPYIDISALLQKSKERVSKSNNIETTMLSNFIPALLTQTLIKVEVHPKNLLISDVRSDEIGKNIIDHFSIIACLVLKIFVFKVQNLVI